MPYRFDESDHEPQTQAQGGGRREPPRTGIGLEVVDEPGPRIPHSGAPLLRKGVQVLALLAILTGVAVLVLRAFLR